MQLSFKAIAIDFESKRLQQKWKYYALKFQWHNIQCMLMRFLLPISRQQTPAPSPRIMVFVFYLNLKRGLE
jgi:hypothetical protein